jgi:hypothetical protein
VISCVSAVFGVVGISVAGPPVAAEAPPVSDNDNPAAPNTGTAFARRLRFDTCFVCGIVESSHAFAQFFRSLKLPPGSKILK